MTENEIAKQILDAAFVVHTKLGPGLLESVYEVVIAYELQKERTSCRTSETHADTVR
jgi:GxxExxY protein